MNKIKNKQLQEVIMTVEQQLIEKGRKEGREEGERKKAIETAKKMKNDGVEINIIMKYTGLNKKDIEKL
jgi:predicted transposase/invertase (TIGR01784 family)